MAEQASPVEVVAADVVSVNHAGNGSSNEAEAGFGKGSSRRQTAVAQVEDPVWVTVDEDVQIAEAELIKTHRA